jgi:hypothetical protein
VSEGAPKQLVASLGNNIVEVDGTDISKYIELLQLDSKEYMMDGGTLLIRTHDRQTRSIDNIQSTLSGNADMVSVRKPNLNDVFLWLSSKDQKLGSN